MKAEHGTKNGTEFVCLPLRGQRRLGRFGVNLSLLLPVELRCVNHTASTNMTHCKTQELSGTLQWPNNSPDTMAEPTPFDQISERVERLLLRHEELQRTNALLLDQVQSLQAERDSLKSRLNAARARIDALLDRLPNTDSAPSAGQEGTE